MASKYVMPGNLRLCLGVYPIKGVSSIFPLLPQLSQRV
jgi:hypothetical protein